MPAFRYNFWKNLINRFKYKLKNRWFWVPKCTIYSILGIIYISLKKSKTTTLNQLLLPGREYNFMINLINRFREKFNRKVILRKLKQFVDKLPTNCLSVFDHFVRLALNRLTSSKKIRKKWVNPEKNLKLKDKWTKLKSKDPLNSYYPSIWNAGLGVNRLTHSTLWLR